VKSRFRFRTEKREEEGREGKGSGFVLVVIKGEAWSRCSDQVWDPGGEVGVVRCHFGGKRRKREEEKAIPWPGAREGGSTVFGLANRIGSGEKGGRGVRFGREKGGKKEGGEGGAMVLW